MTSIGVLADDLTGAMDAGVQLLNEGYTVKVSLDPSQLSDLSAGTDILIVDSESRNVSPNEAAHLIKQSVTELSGTDCNLVYKKVDSTLRGNIGAELSAVFEVYDADCILFVPALPFNHRTTVGGIHYVGGVRLQDTELARDPFAPIYTSNISELIRLQSDLPVELIFIETIRESVKAITECIRDMIARGVKIIVFDSIDDGDLTCIAKAVRVLKKKLVFCGSAGFFRYLTDTGRITPPKRIAKPTLPVTNKNSPVLVLSGSPASMSKKQIAYADTKLTNLVKVQVNLKRLNGGQSENERQRVFERVSGALREGKHVVVDAAGTSKAKLLYSARGSAGSLNCDSQNIQHLLADIAYEMMTDFKLRGLVLFGGDTAISVSKRLCAKGIRVISQAEPYIPIGILEDTVCGDVIIVTKAGGFGNERTLVTVIGELE